MCLIVVFVDVDYFFAQVEEILNPSLRGKPVVVCVFSGRTADSGAVATANYEARRLGVKAGIPIIRAKEIAPSAVFLPMRKGVYEEYSKKVMAILRTVSPRVEVASIDEAYIDISSAVPSFEEGIKLAMKLKERIKEETGLNVTVGVSVNKVFAKVAAESVKPNGFRAIGPDQVEGLIRELDIKEVPGVGPVLTSKLESLGIRKLIDIRSTDVSHVSAAIGRAKAYYLLQLANNTYSVPVEERQKKSVARVLTLKTNSRNLDEMRRAVRKALEDAYGKAEGLPTRIGVMAIMEDLDMISRERSLSHGVPMDVATSICMEMIEEILRKDNRRVRRIGVRLSRFVKSKGLDQFLDLK
jgi:DNA polymerase IV (DinB-like DNA polymerase)